MKTETKTGSKTESNAEKIMEQKVAGNPLRQEDRFYRGAHAGNTMEEATGKRNFKTKDSFVSDSDDDSQIDAELVEAGVEFEPSDQKLADREFDLAQEGQREQTSDLEEEDEDLNDLPKNNPLQADRNL